jgi:hypothetical protein
LSRIAFREWLRYAKRIDDDRAMPRGFYSAGGVVDPMRLRQGSYKRIPGENYKTPKEVWGFRTAPARGSPANIARRFLVANASIFELEPRLAGLEIRHVIRSLGSAHVIMQQIHARRRVHRGYVSVHIDLAGRVFLGIARYPLACCPMRSRSASIARRLCAEHVIRSLAATD